MKRIYKYPLGVADRVVVGMPRGATVMSVQVQNGVPCIWALVDLGEPTTGCVFYIHGTGHEVPAPELKRFIGTVQLHGGSLVFHVFEDKRNGND